VIYKIISYVKEDTVRTP